MAHNVNEENPEPRKSEGDDEIYYNYIRKYFKGESPKAVEEAILLTKERNFIAPENRSLIYDAILLNRLDSVATLLKHGININVIINHLWGRFIDNPLLHMTPLTMAIALARTRIVRLLLESGADVNLTTRGRRSPLHIACLKGKMTYVRWLLPKGPEVNTQDCDGWTPLHCAVTTDKLEIVKLLIAHQADPKLLDCAGNSVLIRAVQAGSLDIVDYLLDLNLIYIDHRNHFYETALTEAAQTNRSDILKVLIEKGATVYMNNRAGINCLHRVVMHSTNLNCLEVLLPAMRNVNIQDNRGFTALFMACSARKVGHAKLLLEAGADPNIPTYVKGYTPLHISVMKNSKELTDLLLKFNADPEARDYRDRLPLHYVHKNQRPNVLNILLNKTKVDVDTEDLDGNTPLHLAARYGHSGKVVAILLELNSRPRVENWKDLPDINILNNLEDSTDDEDKCLKKLNMIGWEPKYSFTESYEKYFEKDFGFEEIQEWKLELDRLAEKFISTNPRTNLYDILRMGYKELSTFTGNELLHKYLGDEQLERDFPNYKIQLKLQHFYVRSMEKALLELRTLFPRFDDICHRRIVFHLGPENLETLTGESFTLNIVNDS